jgi:hypothetical protein
MLLAYLLLGALIGAATLGAIKLWARLTGDAGDEFPVALVVGVLLGWVMIGQWQIALFIAVAMGLIWLGLVFWPGNEE